MIMNRNDLLIRLQNRTRLSADKMFLSDQDYYCPTYDQVKDLLQKTSFERYKYKAETFDCDDFARILSAFVIQCSYDMDWPQPWAFGVVFGYFPDLKGHHARNFCYTQDRELILPEPQNDILYLHSVDCSYSVLFC